MGVVSRGRDVQTGRLVAIKRIRSSDDRAEREALAGTRLRHPAIVELLEAELTDDGWVLVSELVEGADLRAVLRAGPVPELDIARFAGSIVRGLSHAHAHGIIHRDVKPANILCPADPRRAGAWAKLTDFGVAALHDAETLTNTGDVVGTMAYMAPEQARGHRAGAPADVFALAVVVYEALAGINPRRGSTAAETAARALGSMPPLARLRPDLPSSVQAALDHCLELEPAHRGGLEVLDGGLRQLAAVATGGHAAGGAPQTSVTRLGGRTERGQTLHRRSPGPGPRPEEPLVPYLPPPGREPVGYGPARLAAVDDEFGPQGWAGDATARPGPDQQAWPEPVASRGRLPRVPLRLLGAAGAAAGAAVLMQDTVLPAAVGAAAVAGFVVPRMAWLALAITTVVLLTTRDETAAALAAITGLAPFVLFATRGPLWPAAGLAAGLTAISAPAAWPALAALAPNGRVRVALAVHGALVTAVAATATDVPLLLVPAGDFATIGVEFVAPLAATWGVAALLLGAIVRGRTFGADVIAAAAWAGGVGGAMAGAKLADPDPLLWAGPAVAAAVVVVARALTRERTRPA